MISVYIIPTTAHLATVLSSCAEAIPLDGKFDIPVVALIPVFSTFFANWLMSGLSTYYRIHPSVCVAPITRLVMASFVAALLIALLAMLRIAIGGSWITLGLSCINAIIDVLLLYFTNKEMSRVELFACWVFLFFAIATGYFELVGNVSPLMDKMYSLWGVTFSPEKAIVLVIHFSAFFYVIGIIEAATRQIFLVDEDESEIILAIFNEGRCVVATVDHIDNSCGSDPVCYLSSGYKYSQITDICQKKSLYWRRYYSVKPDRSNYVKTRGEYNNNE